MKHSYAEARVECRRQGWPETSRNLHRAFVALGKREKRREQRRAAKQQDAAAIERENARQEAMGLR